MDFVNKLTGDSSQKKDTDGSQGQESSGGFMDKVNSFAGGGKESEKNEDGLDKAVDFVQEKFLGGGDQSNESAAEQAKDEAISDALRDKYKDATGNEFVIPDKDKKFGGT